MLPRATERPSRRPPAGCSRLLTTRWRRLCDVGESKLARADESGYAMQSFSRTKSFRGLRHCVSDGWLLGMLEGLPHVRAPVDLGTEPTAGGFQMACTTSRSLPAANARGANLGPLANKRSRGSHGSPWMGDRLPRHRRLAGRADATRSACSLTSTHSAPRREVERTSRRRRTPGARSRRHVPAPSAA